MNTDEKKAIMQEFIDNPDFLKSLKFFEEQIKKEGNIADLTQLAIWFFSAGYFSRMDSEEKKNKIH